MMSECMLVVITSYSYLFVRLSLRTDKNMWQEGFVQSGIECGDVHRE
jgi:hypothetical protein